MPSKHLQTVSFGFVLLLCLVLYLLSMVTLFETRCYWQGGFTEEQHKYYKEYRLSEKGKHLWEQINKLNSLAENFYSIYDESYFCSLVIFHSHHILHPHIKFLVFSKPERLTTSLFRWGKVVCL